MCGAAVNHGGQSGHAVPASMLPSPAGVEQSREYIAATGIGRYADRRVALPLAGVGNLHRRCAPYPRCTRGGGYLASPSRPSQARIASLSASDCRSLESCKMLVRIIYLLACLAYWALLSVLLLASDPAAVVGLRNFPTFPWGDAGIHFTAFAILAVLVHAAPWRQPPRWLVVAFLLGYGIATESLQALVARRSVEVRDYVEDVLGVLVGTAIAWAVLRRIQQFRQKRLAGSQLPAPSV